MRLTLTHRQYYILPHHPLLHLYTVVEGYTHIISPTPNLHRQILSNVFYFESPIGARQCAIVNSMIHALRKSLFCGDNLKFQKVLVEEDGNVFRMFRIHLTNFHQQGETFSIREVETTIWLLFEPPCRQCGKMGIADGKTGTLKPWETCVTDIRWSEDGNQRYAFQLFFGEVGSARKDGWTTAW